MYLSRCSTCPGPEFRQVLGIGPSPCPFLFIGGGPGKRENVTGQPYTGLAGDELTNTYLPLAYLSRDTVHITNACLCWSGDDRPPSDKRVQDCARGHLPRTLDLVQPEVVVLMGGAGVRLSDKRVRLDMQHGIPFHGSILNGEWEGWIWPSFEPALGMRDTGKMTPLIDDFRRLGQWWGGEWSPPCPPDVKKNYEVVETAGDLQRYLLSDHPGRWGYNAMDTERHGRQSWSVQISIAPYTGRLVRPGSPAIGFLQEYMRDSDLEVVLHNAGQDQDELDRMRIPTPRVRDTMQEAFQQCHLPQGLKPLAYRLLGVTMRSWEDVVWPASIQAVSDWIAEGMWLTSYRPEEKRTELKKGRCAECGHQHSRGPCKRDGCGCVSKLVTMTKVEYQPGTVENILRHVLRYTLAGVEEDGENPYNPWKALEKMKRVGLRGKLGRKDDWDWIEGELGPTPILGIGNVTDKQDEIEYSVGDADMTGQVAGKLAEGLADERWVVPVEDWDS